MVTQEAQVQCTVCCQQSVRISDSLKYVTAVPARTLFSANQSKASLCYDKFHPILPSPFF